jgi:hypothetical protein
MAVDAATRAAIDGLYDAFAARPRRDRTERCECCVTVEEERALHAAPLRELGAKAIARYAASAMTTWGDDRDFAHFLPRIFELVADEDTWLDVEVVVAKLRLAGWRDWSAPEQRAVERYLSALWSATIAADDPVHDAAAVLCAIAQAVDEVGPYLTAWLDDRSVPATGHLVAFALYEWRPRRHRLANPFWADRRPQEDQVIAWLTGAAVAERLADAATEPRGPWADEASLALAGVAAGGRS